jgi:hypothetical protein
MIVAFCGNLGSGKTLMMSSIAYFEALRGKRVYANYALRFAWRFDAWAQLFSLEQGIVCLDEAQVVADSREFKREDVKALTQWILQTRKIGLDFYFTTQHIGQVDTRIRNIVDYMFLFAAVGAPGSGASRWSFFDFQYGVEKASGVFVHSPTLYGLYDTYQRISALI